MKPDIKTSIQAIKDLNLKYMVANQKNLGDVTKSLELLLAIANEIEATAGKLQASGFKEASDALQKLVDQVTDLPVQLQATQPPDRTDEVVGAVEELNQTVKGQKLDPKISVAPASVDLSPLSKPLQTLIDKVEKLSNKEDKDVDTQSIVKATEKVSKAINGLRFPVPNYVLPFKNSSGAAAQVQLDSSGNLPVAATFTPSGTQDVNVTSVGGNAVTATIPVAGTGTAGTPGTAVLTVQGVGSGTAQPVTVSSGTVTTVTNITNQGQLVDNAAFTDGTTRLNMVGFIYDEVAGTALTENDGAAARINVNRAVVNALEDGVTRGRYATVTASNALKVDGSAVTQPVSIAATVVTQETQPASPTLANVTMTGSSVTLQASNTARRNLMIFNDSGVVVYVKLGSSASATSFTVKLVDQAYYELPAPVYTGIVTALGASGSVRVTEVV